LLGFLIIGFCIADLIISILDHFRHVRYSDKCQLYRRFQSVRSLCQPQRYQNSINHVIDKPPRDPALNSILRDQKLQLQAVGSLKSSQRGLFGGESVLIASVMLKTSISLAVLILSKCRSLVINMASVPRHVAA